jgi:UDP-GlcNAc3NAcA epimerase
MSKPKYNLNINGGTHGRMTGQMLEDIEKVLIEEKPDYTLVYGDTNSTLAGALASVKLNIPVLHVESGLRNNDFTIPEDINRTLTDRVSKMLFYSTDQALLNLLKEGYESFDCKLVRIDDLMSDLYYFTSNKVTENEVKQSMDLNIDEEYILCTIHRQLTTEPKNLINVISFLNLVADEFAIVLPIHPRTKIMLEKLECKVSGKIKIIEPVGYFDMFNLLKNSKYVITDSGGLQKEAYLHGKYSMLLMDFTPWVELVKNNVSIETDLTIESLQKNFNKMKELNGNFTQLLYGSGNASKQIVSSIVDFEF